MAVGDRVMVLHNHPLKGQRGNVIGGQRGALSVVHFVPGLLLKTFHCFFTGGNVTVVFNGLSHSIPVDHLEKGNSSNVSK
jgi:hypothetical protein